MSETSRDKTTEHLCLSCSLAKWRKTSNGRLHPDGQGRCGWKPPYIPTPAAWTWNLRNRNQPEPAWGWIERKPTTPLLTVRHTMRFPIYRRLTPRRPTPGCYKMRQRAMQKRRAYK